MKRYNFLPKSSIFISTANGEYVLFKDFINFISARIKELETEIQNEDSIYSEASCRFRIDELKRLIK